MVAAAHLKSFSSANNQYTYDAYDVVFQYVLRKYLSGEIGKKREKKNKKTKAKPKIPHKMKYAQIYSINV